MSDETQLREVVEEGTRIHCLEPDLYSVYEPGENTNTYDRAAPFYDLIMCSRLYNTVIWGYPISHYETLCRDNLSSSDQGWVLDAGCGSLAFSAEAYAEPLQRPVVLLDQSVGMLQLAKARLIRRCGKVPDNLFLLHGDALALPFRAQAFRSILCMNILHVLDDMPAVLRQLQGVLETGGSMRLTTLIQSGRWADVYMNTLATTGEIIGRTEGEVQALFDTVQLSVDRHVTGSLLTLQHPATA